MPETVAQLLLGGLLLTTSGWCIAVHHRLRRLRIERGELNEFLSLLNTASERAEAALTNLRADVIEIERSGAQRAEEVTRRTAELSRVVESGSQLLRRLEPAVHHTARVAAGHSLREPSAREPLASRPTGEPPGSAERDALRRALETLR